MSNKLTSKNVFVSLSSPSRCGCNHFLVNIQWADHYTYTEKCLHERSNDERRHEGDATCTTYGIVQHRKYLQYSFEFHFLLIILYHSYCCCCCRCCLHDDFNCINHSVHYGLIRFLEQIERVFVCARASI